MKYTEWDSLVLLSNHIQRKNIQKKILKNNKLKKYCPQLWRLMEKRHENVSAEKISRSEPTKAQRSVSK